MRITSIRRPYRVHFHQRTTKMPENSLSRCSQCTSAVQCWPTDLPHGMFDHISAAVLQRRRLVRGEHVQRQGDTFKHVIAVCRGVLRTSMSTLEGGEQVTGFPMAGDFIGLDGVAHGTVGSDAMALGEAEVRIIPFASLETLARESRVMQRHIYRLMGQEIEGKQRAQLQLNHLRADGRVASVLLQLSQRLAARGHSPSDIDLPMTRKDLGSLVRLTLESVSRALTRMAAAGILEVESRRVRILDHSALTRMATPAGMPLVGAGVLI